MRSRGIFVGIVLLTVSSAVVFVTFSGLLPLKDTSSDRCIAKVGKECLSLEEYRTTYRNEVAYIESIVRHKLSEEQLERFGVKDVTLKRMINDMVLAKFAKDIGVVVSPHEIKNFVRNMHVFKNKEGVFDEQRFKSLLSDAGMTEMSYLEKVRSSLQSVMLLECMFPKSPALYSRYYDIFAKDVLTGIMQSRIVDIIEISPEAIKDVTTPEHSELESMYSEGLKNGEFMSPEYRSVKYTVVNEEDALEQTSVSESELNSEIKNSELEDQRDVLNLVFSTEDEANAAYNSLKEGKTFESLISDNETTAEDITLKSVTKGLLPIEARGRIFALAEGEVSEVFRSVVGWHIMKVVSKHKISSEDLKELKEKVSLSIRKQKARELFSGRLRKANAIISESESFQEVESVFTAPSSGVIEKFDMNGLNTEGAAVDFPQVIQPSEALMTLVFSSQLEKPSHFVNMGDFYVSVTVTEVIDPRVRTFDESQPLLLEKWHKNFVMDKMLVLAKDLSEKLRKGVELEKIEGVTVKRGESVQETSGRSKSAYPNSLIERVFNIRVGEVVDAVVEPNSGKLFIAALLGIKDPEVIEEKILEKFKEDFTDEGMATIMDQFLNHLVNKYQVQVNRKSLESI